MRELKHWSAGLFRNIECRQRWKPKILYFQKQERVRKAALVYYCGYWFINSNWSNLFVSILKDLNWFKSSFFYLLTFITSCLLEWRKLQCVFSPWTMFGERFVLSINVVSCPPDSDPVFPLKGRPLPVNIIKIPPNDDVAANRILMECTMAGLAALSLVDSLV